MGQCPNLINLYNIYKQDDRQTSLYYNAADKTLTYSNLNNWLQYNVVSSHVLI